MTTQPTPRPPPCLPPPHLTGSAASRVSASLIRCTRRSLEAITSTAPSRVTARSCFDGGGGVCVWVCGGVGVEGLHSRLIEK